MCHPLNGAGVRGCTVALSPTGEILGRVRTPAIVQAAARALAAQYAQSPSWQARLRRAVAGEAPFTLRELDRDHLANFSPDFQPVLEEANALAGAIESILFNAPYLL